MMRRNVRDLRKGLFGPKRSSDVPKGKGVQTFLLPYGWTLRLRYDASPDGRSKPSDVVAEFIPPTVRKRGPVSTPRAAVSPLGVG